MLGVKITLSCFRQLPLNSNLILELFTHARLEERLWFDVKRGLFFSFDNPLGSHWAFVFGRTKNIVKVVKVGWNIKKFCDPSSLK